MLELLTAFSARTPQSRLHDSYSLCPAEIVQPFGSYPFRYQYFPKPTRHQAWSQRSVLGTSYYVGDISRRNPVDSSCS
jgi:hypothetical protein